MSLVAARGFLGSVCRMLNALPRPHRIVALLESLGDIEQFVYACDLLLSLIVVGLASGLIAPLIPVRATCGGPIKALIKYCFL